MERPAIVNDEHLIYLDDLRDSGETNMFGAADYVVIEFKISLNDARTITSYWMKSFGKENR